MFKIHSSRRVSGLKPGDCDHEISIVDNDNPISRYTTTNTTDTDNTDYTQISRVSTTAQLLPRTDEHEEDDTVGGHTALGSERNGSRQVEERPPDVIRHQHELPHPALSPTIEVQEPTTEAFHGDHPLVKPPKPKAKRETVIDILYENERGGFLCGMSLFSGAALGSLDSQPWTNAYHKPSPTDIRTATVPDPSWEWVWPEWRINHQEGMDEGGWEYSFAFSSKFSWHGPRWWNSYVRRRAWIRKRGRISQDEISDDPHMLNTNYFAIRPVADRRRKLSRESLPSGMGSRTSLTQHSSTDGPLTEEPPDIDDIDILLDRLRQARVDREKLEAVDVYLGQAIDLSRLSDEMHEIMSLFVFQASRRILLTRLMQIYDETKQEIEEDEANQDPTLKDREQALKAALVHADEEVRRLAYWSDVKEMADRGDSQGAVDNKQGWYDTWEGLDNSGPSPPKIAKSTGE